MKTFSLRKTFVAATLAAGFALAGAAPAIADFYRVDRVGARMTDTWTMWAPSGFSRVVVEGDGDTDLDCYVYDRFGRLLGSDDDDTDYCIVDVRQATSGNLRVSIRNLGRVWNQYRLSVQ